MSDPKRDAEDTVRQNQVSIFYLAGCDHLTQSTIVSMVLDALFSHCASLTNRIPRFQTVIEEAHNLIARCAGQAVKERRSGWLL
jgi:hypothetical protein